MRRTTHLLPLLLAGGVLCHAAGRAAADPPPDGRAFFEQRIRPLLAGHCYKCHSGAAKKRKGGLALDTRDGVRAGGNAGPAIVPGDPDKSLLVRAVRHTDEDLKM